MSTNRAMRGSRVTTAVRRHGVLSENEGCIRPADGCTLELGVGRWRMSARRHLPPAVGRYGDVSVLRQPQHALLARSRSVPHHLRRAVRGGADDGSGRDRRGRRRSPPAGRSGRDRAGGGWRSGSGRAGGTSPLGRRRSRSWRSGPRGTPRAGVFPGCSRPAPGDLHGPATDAPADLDFPAAPTRPLGFPACHGSSCPAGQRKGVAGPACVRWFSHSTVPRSAVHASGRTRQVPGRLTSTCHSPGAWMLTKPDMGIVTAPSVVPSRSMRSSSPFS